MCHGIMELVMYLNIEILKPFWVIHPHLQISLNHCAGFLNLVFVCAKEPQNEALICPRVSEVGLGLEPACDLSQCLGPGLVILTNLLRGNVKSLI